MQSIDKQFADPATYGSPDTYHQLMARLRKEDPVHWAEPDGIRPFWLLSRHADIVAVERNPEAFINAPRITLATIAMEDRLAELRKGEGGNQLIRSMNGMDGVEHRLYRGVTQRDFLRPTVENLSAKVEEIAAEFVQRLIDKGPECDFVREVTRWYPLRVIMMLLGVPVGDERKMLFLTEQLFGVADPDVQGEYGGNRESKDTVGEFFDYFRVLLEDRRRQPRDDLASKIANAQIDGKLIDDFEALSYYVTIATAGHDTTGATIAGGLLALIQHPDELQRLRNNPGLLKTAPDEMMRWVAPVKHFFRTAVKNVELSGKLIKEGDGVLLAFPSGCRDESVYEDPFVFRLDRPTNPHLALGDGAHVCLGQHLAKLEIRMFFKQLLARIESIELAGDPAWVEGSFISGLKRLPVRFKTKG